MPEQKYDAIKLVGLHEPDSTMNTNADGVREKGNLPGLYSVGFEANGRFVKIATVKAGDMVDKENKVVLGKKSDDSSTDES
jgi:hypothetical protein